MANNISNLMFRAMYRFGFKPWDSGIPPPELKELIEGPQARTPGKALDLGCGTGTNTMYMAQHGWDVTWIDFVATAIAAARKKMQAANVAPRLIQGDVTRLKELGLGAGYSLVFDLGCLHSIPEVRRDAYAAGVNEVTVPGADFLVWGFYAKPNFFVNAKLAQDELEQLFGKSWDMVRAWGGEQPDRFPGRWYDLRRAREILVRRACVPVQVDGSRPVCELSASSAQRPGRTPVARPPLHHLARRRARRTPRW